jgi:hypothetical protein
MSIENFKLSIQQVKEQIDTNKESGGEANS